MAMARPRRPVAEAEMLRAAWGALCPDLPPRQAAHRLAKEVAERVAAEADMEPFPRALAAAERMLQPDPIATLADDPEIDTGAPFRAERLSRYEARGCTQLGPLDWRRETKEITTELRRKLSLRYERTLRNIST